jgi:acyl-CoA thioester hydrolase
MPLFMLGSVEKMLVSKKEIEVRYAETDQMGVVYHANYLVWMELGRTKLISDLGFNYADLEALGVISPVIDLSISYKKSAKYGDVITIYTWINEYNGIRVKYEYEIMHNESILAKGTSEHVCVKKENFRPISIKKHFPNWHEAYLNAMKENEN